jgi:NADH-quinone oxidoreductase subunit M
MSHTSDTPWMLILLLVPLAGAAAVSVIGAARLGDELAKKVGFAVSAIELVLAIVMLFQYKVNGGVFQFGTDTSWISQFGVRFSLGADGIALVLIALTALLVPVVLLASWHEAEQGKKSASTFFALVLALQSLLVGVFAATDLFLFYVFFEAMLIPMYFLIGSYGGGQRQYASVKFLLYSLFGGLLMLAALIGLYQVSANQLGTGTFDFATLTTLKIGKTTQDFLFLGFFLAFAIKAPLVPFHTWLPDAGAEGPTGGSVLLVGVMDKVGTFGFIRYCLPLFPDASKTFGPWILGLAIAGILYGAIVAIGQRDLKRLVSYTSVAHFGFIALGIFAFTSQGGTGAVLYMVNHGISTGALFLIVGFLVTRRGSRDVADFGGVGKVAPVLGAMFLVVGLSSLALPGTNSFVSEFLTLVGTFTTYPAAAIVATLGIVLAAIYILWAYQRVVQGPVAKGIESMQDLSLREICALAPMVALIIALGVYPKPILDIITPSVDRTLVSVGKEDPAPKHPIGYDLKPASYGGPRVTDHKLGPRVSPFITTGSNK